MEAFRHAEQRSGCLFYLCGELRGGLRRRADDRLAVPDPPRPRPAVPRPPGVAGRVGPVSDLDPHWEWTETRTLAGRVHYLRGRCHHLEVVPVESGGEVVA